MKMLLSLTLALLMSLTPVLSSMGAGVMPAHAQPSQRGGLSVPVTPTATNPTSGETITGPGTLTISRFVASDGQVLAVGTLTFPLPGGGTGVAPVAWPTEVVPQQAPPGTCPILHLEIAPIELDLLGLVVSVPSPIIIDIFADPGPGNLLGNLLCAIAGLLDGPLGQLVAALNRLLGLLGSL